MPAAAKTTAGGEHIVVGARRLMCQGPVLRPKIVFVAWGPGIDFLLADAKDQRDNLSDHAVIP